MKELLSLWRKAMNYGTAMAKHVAAGRPVVSLEVLEQRQGEARGDRVSLSRQIRREFAVDKGISR